MKPLISYYGGKQRMAPKIVPLIPPHTVYVEPFAGGAAVFYAKPKPTMSSNNHYREVLNDINGELVNMYQQAKSSPEKFASSIQAIPFAKSIHSAAKDRTGCPSCRAVKKFIRHNQSFAACDGRAFARSSFGTNRAETWANQKLNNQAASQRLDRVFIDSIDAIRCINAWDSPHTFFYIDPPYFGTDCDGMGKWTDRDLINLSDALNNANGSWIVSGYNELRGILKYNRMLSFVSNCGATSDGKTGKKRNFGEPIKGAGRERTERLFMRGPTQPVRSSLIPILEKQTCFTGPLLGPCPLPLKSHPSAKTSRTFGKVVNPA